MRKKKVKLNAITKVDPSANTLRAHEVNCPSSLGTKANRTRASSVFHVCVAQKTYAVLRVLCCANFFFRVGRIERNSAL